MADQTKTEDKITITYSIDAEKGAPNICKAETAYKGQNVVAYGSRWSEAKQGVIAQAKQLKALGEPPANDEIDLDMV